MCAVEVRLYEGEKRCTSKKEEATRKANFARCGKEKIKNKK
jgi:hypothetical protein